MARRVLLINKHFFRSSPSRSLRLSARRRESRSAPRKRGAPGEPERALMSGFDRTPFVRLALQRQRPPELSPPSAVSIRIRGLGICNTAPRSYSAARARAPHGTTAKFSRGARSRNPNSLAGIVNRSAASDDAHCHCPPRAPHARLNGLIKSAACPSANGLYSICRLLRRFFLLSIIRTMNCSASPLSRYDCDAVAIDLFGNSHCWSWIC